MKNRNSIFLAIAGISLFLSSAAIAGSSSSEHKSQGSTSEMMQTPTLEQLIQENTEKKRQADAAKYAKITTLAGNRKDELAKKMDEVNDTYKKWHELKSAAESSSHTSATHFKVIEMAAQAYSKANKEFIDLQKDILAKNGVAPAELNTRIVVNIIPTEAIDAVNTAPATAAGKK